METSQSKSNTRMLDLCQHIKNSKEKMINLTMKLKKIGKEDPRRITHSFKFGFALTLVSIFYYVNPIFAGFGVSAMWAVLTVVVVMEYSVGATLSKGFNRTVGTIVAGALGIGAHQIASLCGEKGEPIVLGILVFILASMATYSRFIPEIKAEYDYGVIVFILTFSLVTVSSYRVEELIQLSHQRMSTIAIGVSICVFSSVFVMPVWAGEDLHDLVAANLDKFSNSLKGMGEVYFTEEEENNVSESKHLCNEYKGVLNSKAVEDSLANFAGWEPSHGRFSFRHPWKQYQKIAGLTRQCAYSIEVLQNYIIATSSKHKGTKDSQHLKTHTACRNMCMESSNTLSELASSIQTMTVIYTCNEHLNAAIEGKIQLRTSLSEQTTEPFPVALETAVAASLVMDVVEHVHRISVSVQELAKLARFKCTSKASVKVLSGGLDCEVVNIAVE